MSDKERFRITGKVSPGSLSTANSTAPLPPCCRGWMLENCAEVGCTISCDFKLRLREVGVVAVKDASTE